MLEHFKAWLETLMFLVAVSLVLLTVMRFAFTVSISFFESFGISVFIINIIGISSQLYRISKNSEDS